jgi:hypothetical protein
MHSLADQCYTRRMHGLHDGRRLQHGRWFKASVQSDRHCRQRTCDIRLEHVDSYAKKRAGQSMLVNYRMAQLPMAHLTTHPGCTALALSAIRQGTK